jgi:hypothetical protein
MGSQPVGVCFDFRLWRECLECCWMKKIKQDSLLAVRVLSLRLRFGGLQRAFETGTDSPEINFKCRVWHLKVSVIDGVMLQELEPIIADRGRALGNWARTMFDTGKVDARIELWLNISDYSYEEHGDNVDEMWDKVS